MTYAHLPPSPSRRVQKMGSPSTPCGATQPAPTCADVYSSPIHNPYYYYYILFNYKAVGGKGKSCAYQS